MRGRAALSMRGWPADPSANAAASLRLNSDEPPERCFLPKKHIFTWPGHTKGVQAVRFFPRSGHLLLSCGMDTQVKVRPACVGRLRGAAVPVLTALLQLWEVYNHRRLIRTYRGHSKSVRDISFNNDGPSAGRGGRRRLCASLTPVRGTQ